MAAESAGEWPSWVPNAISGLGAGLVTLGVAHLNKRAALERAQEERRAALEKAENDRKAKLEETIDSRIRQILADDEKTIRRLSRKIDALETYVRVLMTALLKAGVAIPSMPRDEKEEPAQDEGEPANA
jgi:hypothetical protein